MKCQRCGSNRIRYREIRFMDTVECVCSECEFHWMQMGKPQSGAEFKSNIVSLWESWKVYVSHAVIVWFIVSILHFLVALPHPIDAISTIREGWISLSFSVIFIGISLGFVLSNAILISGRFWPQKPAVHIALPLFCAASVGILQGILWLDPNFVLSTSNIMLRSEIVVLISGTLLALLSTPIIIVRSSSVLRRKGLR